MSADLVITMLDGELGAVTDPENTSVLPFYPADCWCGCVSCFSEEPREAVETVPAVIG